MAADARRRRWDRLTCQQLDAELAVQWHGKTTRREGEDAALAVMIAADRISAAEDAAAEAARVAALPPALPEPEPMSAQSPQERPSGVVVPFPAPNVADDSRPRKRRRPRAYSINTYGLRDSGYNDPMRED